MKVKKSKLISGLTELRKDLDRLYYERYFSSDKDYEKWRKDYVPFHWLSEFYGIMGEKGGFDVIVGNPPYVKFNSVSYSLDPLNLKCPNLYGYVVKRCYSLVDSNSWVGLIVMHNLGFASDFTEVRDSIYRHCSKAWFSFFSRIPDGLFSEARVRNCILLSKVGKEEPSIQVTRFYRWNSEYRPYLLNNLHYITVKKEDILPMIGDEHLYNFFNKKYSETIKNYIAKSKTNSAKNLYFKTTAYNWLAISPQPAPCFDNKENPIPQSKVSSMTLKTKELAHISMLLCSGRLAFSKWLAYGDDMDCTQSFLKSLPLPYSELVEEEKKELAQLYIEYANKLDLCVQFKLNSGKRVGTYNTTKVWEITDRSDEIILGHLVDNPKMIIEAIKNHIGQLTMEKRSDDDDTED